MMSMTRSPPSVVVRGCKVRMIGARADGFPPAPVASTGRGVRSSSDPPARPDVTPAEAGNETVVPGPAAFVLEDVDLGGAQPGAGGVVGLPPGGT